MNTRRLDPVDPTTNDEAAGFDIQDNFERFHQRDEMFRRSRWDESIRDEKVDRFYRTHSEPLSSCHTADGFSQRDYAIRNAGWHVSEILADSSRDEDRREGFNDEYSSQVDVARARFEYATREEAATDVKRAARRLGADLVGITAFDSRWMYTKKFRDRSKVEKPQEIPSDMTSVVVIAKAMDYQLMRTVPSALGSTATGLGYAHDATVVISIAQYIRNIGYKAIASMNDTSISIPLAIKAGLGEYGRLGLLITKEFGPRVRIGKVYTDLPLSHDEPIQFGVREFCGICFRCAKECPVKAISHDKPTPHIHNRSNIRGVRKWSIDAEKCFGLWAAQNTDCSICIRACPYNKDYSTWWHRVARWFAGTRLRRLLHWFDIKMGYGKRLAPKEWWQSRR